MGIDPVTHQPHHKQPEPATEPSPRADHSPGGATSNNGSDDQNSSCSPSTHQNCSGNESQFLGISDVDDPLMSCLWDDETNPLVVDPSWEFPNFDHLGFPSWGEDCQWLLDCQDFGVHDFGVNGFEEVQVMNGVNTLDMGYMQ
ncbi:hypothetical protein U1Q18_019446 [Sarracenia purpurea var. burkii]